MTSLIIFCSTCMLVGTGLEHLYSHAPSISLARKLFRKRSNDDITCSMLFRCRKYVDCSPAKRFSRVCRTWLRITSCFKLGNHYLYTCMILDLFSCKVIAYKISKKNSTQLITSTFKIAWEQRTPEAKLIFHSHRGSQYTSHRFRQLLHERFIVQSFSNSGKPHDNAVAESFFATFKKEEAYRKNYTSEADFKWRVDSYIEFYNTQRPHHTLKNLTPCQVEDVFMKGNA